MKKQVAVLALAVAAFFFLACSGGGGGGDDAGSPASPTARIDRDGDGYSTEEGDCDDNDPGRGPAEPEICGDGIDQDCDGADASCNTEDVDRDGYAAVDGDCDDGNAAIHPDAEEICGDGIDQNCDGADAPCRIAQADRAAFDEFADTFVQSLEEENLDMYMSLFSDDVLSDGQDFACFRDIQNWNFRYYDFAGVQYQFNGEPAIREENGRTLATVNRTVRYSRISPSSGMATPVESTGDAYLIQENGLWMVYGNRAGVPSPVWSDFTTSTDIDETTGTPVNITHQFTNADEEIQLFFTVDNVMNGAEFTVRIVKPNGAVYSESPYSINWGDFPRCARSQTSWNQTIQIFSAGDIDIPIPGVDIGFGLEAMGTWTVELTLEGYGLLGYGNFEYMPLDDFWTTL